jgi:hypothetical protein
MAHLRRALILFSLLVAMERVAGAAPAPEIDASSMPGAAAALLGAVFLITAPRRRK